MNGDILFNVYQFLSINDIQSCMLVSSTFYTFIDHHFWKTLLIRDYCDMNTDDLKKDKFYFRYIKCHQLNRLKNKLYLKESIDQLAALQTLKLAYNQLTSLPREFGELAGLQTLSLANNHLTSLPREFGQLTALQTLDLYNNQLTSLPTEFGQLAALQTLHLDNNQLTSLPTGFGELAALQTLHLSANLLNEANKYLSNTVTILCI